METFITQHWNKYLEMFDESQKDIYFFEEYVKLYESDVDQAYCVVCCESPNVMLMPFLRREIRDGYDFETAYGYGGMIANTHNQQWIDGAIALMWEQLKKEKYVCGFVRFHPLLNNAKICKECNAFYDRQTVVINTENSEEQIWREQITSKNRNMIRKAKKNGLEYKAEYDFQSLKEFKHLYNATMRRLEADDFYFFDDEYYEEFVASLKGRAFLGTVRKEGKLICAALFMFSKDYGHYHLEGSDYSCSKLAANNLLLWETAIEFHKLGVKEFHLGGGYNSEPDNSLFKFKKSFSGNLRDFCIGKMIFNQEIYDEMKNKWKQNNPTKLTEYGNLLLCYRY